MLVLLYLYIHIFYFPYIFFLSYPHVATLSHSLSCLPPLVFPQLALSSLSQLNVCFWEQAISARQLGGPPPNTEGPFPHDSFSS